MVDLGIPVDIMGGTSVGSAMTGAIAIGVPANEIGHRVEEIFVRSGAMRKITVPKYAFLDHTVLDRALLHHFGAGAIEDLWLPYYAVAADLSAVGRRDIRRGPLWEAIRASSAIPGVLPAFYTHDGAMLVDGGCIDNLPFRTMHGLKSGPNIVVNVQKESGSRFNVDYASLPGRMALLRKTLLPFGKRPPRAPGVISTVMRSLLVGQADTMAGLDPTDILISPPILEGAGFLAWEKHKLIFEVSYKHAKDHFAALIAQNDPAFAGLLAAAGLDGRAS
jgi:NTE family protein